MLTRDVLLTTGNINIPLKILDDFGPHFPAGSATVGFVGHACIVVSTWRYDSMQIWMPTCSVTEAVAI
jgi:hypothetical protein